MTWNRFAPLPTGAGAGGGAQSLAAAYANAGGAGGGGGGGGTVVSGAYGVPQLAAATYATSASLSDPSAASQAYAQQGGNACFSVTESSSFIITGLTSFFHASTG